MNSNLDELNGNSLYSAPEPEIGSIFTKFALWSLLFVKTGKMVTMYANVSAIMEASNDFETLITIPESFRPGYNLVNSYATQFGDCMCLFITKEGLLQLYNNNKRITNGMFRQCLSWTTT